MKITLERKILENDIGKENNIIDKYVNDICDDVGKINFHISNDSLYCRCMKLSMTGSCIEVGASPIWECEYILYSFILHEIACT